MSPINRLFNATSRCGLIVVCILWFGCSRGNQEQSAQPTNGTTVLLFPEWANSQSAFERTVYTNYYAVYSNGMWFTRERQNSDGALAVFWKSDNGNKSIEDAKTDFGLNIQWNVYKGIYDAFSK